MVPRYLSIEWRSQFGNQKKIAMIQLIEQFRPDIERLCLRYHVKYLAVFGSAISGAFSPESDVDLLVEFDGGLSAREYSSDYFGLKAGLENILGRDVDLVTVNSLTNPYFRDAVMSEQQTVYAA